MGDPISNNYTSYSNPAAAEPTNGYPADMADNKVNGDSYENHSLNNPRNAETTTTAGRNALTLLSDPNAPRLDASSAKANADQTVTLSYAKPNGGEVTATVSKNSVTFHLSTPYALDQPMSGPATPGAPTDPQSTVAEYTVEFSKMEDLGAVEEGLMEDLTKALNLTDLEGVAPPAATAVELAGARMNALQDPSFWSEVGERLSDYNVQTLADGTSTSVKAEVPVEVTPKHQVIEQQRHAGSIGGGGGTRNVAVDVPAVYTIRIDGKEETGKRSKDGHSLKVDDKTYPLRFDEDSGKWMAVTEHKPMTEDVAKTGAITGELNERTAAAVSNALPITTGADGVALNTLGFMPDKPNNIQLSYPRGDDVVETVTISNQAVTFNAYIPDDLPGKEDKDGFNTLKTSLQFKDMQSWGADNNEKMNDFRDMLDNLDDANYNPEQQRAIDTLKVRIDSLRDPDFWNDVNTEIGQQLDATLPDEGPIAITERFDVIIQRDLDKDGTTSTTFLREDSDGKQSKIEINDDNTVTIEGKDYPVATDSTTGDFVIAKAYRTTDQLTNQVISKEIAARVENAEGHEGRNDSPLAALGAQYDPAMASV